MTCPDCGQDTVTTPTGLHLTPARSRVGRYLPDGTEITPDELRQGVRAHLLHYCPPISQRVNHPATTRQEGLF